MTQDSKKRMYLSDLATNIYMEFFEISGFDLRIKHIAEKPGSYEILLAYMTNPKNKEREYFYYLDVTEFNDIIKYCEIYDISAYLKTIAKVIGERLKKEAGIYD